MMENGTTLNSYENTGTHNGSCCNAVEVVSTKRRQPSEQ